MIKKIWQNILSCFRPPSYDSFFAGRNRDEQSFDLPGIDKDIIGMVLLIIKDNFWLDEEQVLLLHPDDDLLDLYRACYSDSSLVDNMEFEDTWGDLAKVCGDKKLEVNSWVIRDLLKQINQLNQEKNGAIIEKWRKKTGSSRFWFKRSD